MLPLALVRLLLTECFKGFGQAFYGVTELKRVFVGRIRVKRIGRIGRIKVLRVGGQIKAKD